MFKNKLITILVSIFLLYTISGFIIIPNVAKSQLEKILNENLTQKASIEKIKFNPFLFNLSLENLKISNEKQTTLSLKKLYIDFFLLKSIDEGHISFKDVEVEDIYVNIIEDKNGIFNLQKLLKEQKEKDKKPENDKDSDIKFQIYKTALKNAKIKFTKQFKNKKPLIINIDPINYTLYDLGTFQNQLASHSLKLTINKLTSINMDGGLRLSPFEVYGNVKVNKLFPTQFIPYKDDNLNFKINKDSFVNLFFGYNFDTKKEPNIKIDKLNTNINKLQITQKEKQLIALEKLDIKNLSFRYPQNIANIEQIVFDKLNTNILIDEKGKLNLSTLIKTPETKIVEDTSKEDKQNPFDIHLKQFKLRNSNLKFEDINSLLSINTKNINIDINDTKLKNNNLNISNLLLDKLQLELEDKKNNLLLSSKDISIKLDEINNKNEESSISKILINYPYLSFENKTAYTKILAENIDYEVNKLYFSKNNLEIENLNLNKPKITVTLEKSPKKNKKETKEKIVEQKSLNKQKKEKSNFSFNIGPFNIKDASMSFEDKNLPIPFKTNITELHGNFSQLNSNSSKPTKLNLEGKVDKYGFSKITGIVDINDIKLLTDTNILFKNIAIKNFTPYSGKFIGREIKSGKLDLDLRYNIKNSNLDAQNSIIISDIKLGDTVKSEDAVNLPLELAIALLEDSKGVVDIKLPIKGNVDDPQFSIAPIVWKAFTNLIFKAVTAPFNLLGSLLGIDSEKLKKIDFEYGKSDIITSEKESLDAIAKVLLEKPKLAMKIEPTYNLSKDKYALQKQKFEKILNEKTKTISQKDKYKIALEDLYSKLKPKKSLTELKNTFTSENKDKKKVFNQDKYLNHIKNLLITKQEIEEKKIIELTKLRIENIKNYLFEKKKISHDSIIIEKSKKVDDSKSRWTKYKLSVTTK